MRTGNPVDAPGSHRGGDKTMPGDGWSPCTLVYGHAM